MKRIISISSGIICIKSASIVLVQRKTSLDSFREIRVCDKHSSKGNQVSGTFGQMHRMVHHSRIPACAYKRALPDLAKHIQRIHFVFNLTFRIRARLRKMHIGQFRLSVLERLSNVTPGLDRLRIVHARKGTPRRKSDRGTFRTHCSSHRINYFQHKSCTVLDRATVSVLSMIGREVDELVGKTAIGTVDFYSIESGLFDRGKGGLLVSFNTFLDFT
ncbi:unnamed protein product [Rhizopus stolonifer]